MGPLTVHMFLQLAILMKNQNSLRNIFEWIILLFITSKVLQVAKQATLIPPIWANSLTKFKSIFNILNLFWT